MNLIGCEPGERVEAFVSVKEFDDEHYIDMSTQNGIVKKTVYLHMENQVKVEYMLLTFARVISLLKPA